MNRWWLVGTFAIWAFVLVSNLLPCGGVTDPAYFTYVGRCLNAGRHLYVDVWDCKGPILYWMSALGVWLDPYSGYTLLFAAFWAADLLLFHRLARYLGARPGPCVFLFSLFAFGCGQDCFTVIGRQEALGVFFVVWALLLDRLESRRRLFDFATGVCGGLALMVKPTFAAFGIFLLVEWLADAVATRNWRVFWLRVGCAAGGGMLVLAVCTAVYLPDHVADFWNGALLWNLFERVNNNPRGHWLGLLWGNGGFIRRHGWSLFLFLPLAATALSLVLRQGRRGWPLAAWLTAELLLLFAISDFYGYYVVIITLSVLLILSSTLSRRALSLLTLVVVLVFSVKTVPETFRFYATARDRMVEWKKIRQLVRKHPGPVAVSCGNRTTDIMNRMQLFSSQKYTYWDSWERRCADGSRQAMRDDFNRALADPNCRVIIGHTKSYMIAHGASAEELAKFRQVYEASNLCVRVFLRKAKERSR